MTLKFRETRQIHLSQLSELPSHCTVTLLQLPLQHTFVCLYVTLGFLGSCYVLQLVSFTVLGRLEPPPNSVTLVGQLSCVFKLPLEVSCSFQS